MSPGGQYWIGVKSVVIKDTLKADAQTQHCRHTLLLASHGNMPAFLQIKLSVLDTLNSI
jgi:hypothetical protein